MRFSARRFRGYFKLGSETLGVHPWLSVSFGTSAAAGGTGGPFDLAAFRTHGIGVSGQTFQRRPITSLVAGLVPDGVASVTLELPAHLSHGQTLFHTRYPDPYRATARVADNVFFLPAVPRAAAVAVQQTTTIWRAADGRLVRVIRNP